MPPGKQHLAAGVHWMNNGNLTIEGLVLGGHSYGNRQD
jgi:hypothetical protein